MRKSADGRSAVDILKDGEDDSGSVMPRVLAVTVIVSVVLIVVIAVALTSKKSPAEVSDTATLTPDVSSKAPEFVASRTRTQQPVAVAQPVFLPASAAAPSRFDTSSNPVGANSPDFTIHGNILGSHGKVFQMLVDDPYGPSRPGSPAVRIVGGILRVSASRKMAIGRVSLVNSTEDNVTEFRLKVMVNGRSNPVDLEPFEGSPDRPRPFTSLTIHPGEQLTVPVMLKGLSGGKKGAILQSTILLDAWLDSASVTVTHDQLETP